MRSNELSDEDYGALADLRHALRAFQAFSEAHALEHGLTTQQHQALLAIRGAPSDTITVGYIADRLLVKAHSASGLVARLETAGLVRRHRSRDDRRQALIALTPKARARLDKLSMTHREELVRLRPLLRDLLDRLTQRA